MFSKNWLLISPIYFQCSLFAENVDPKICYHHHQYHYHYFSNTTAMWLFRVTLPFPWMSRVHSFYSGANTYNTPGSLGGREGVTAGILVEVEPYQEVLSRQWFLTRCEHQNCLSSFLNMHVPKPHHRFWFNRSGIGLGILIFLKLQGDSDGTSHWESQLWIIRNSDSLCSGESKE